jgi:hypothetical protein
LPHHDFFFSIYIKFLKKIHPFLICKSPYSNGIWYFYLTLSVGPVTRMKARLSYVLSRIVDFHWI